MPHVRVQVDALREAFSADTSKPFILKQSFPYSSPQTRVLRSSVVSTQYVPPPRVEPSVSSTQQLQYLSQPISPPLTAGGLNSRGDSPTAQVSSLMTVPQSREPQQQIPSSMPMMDTITWNPSKIFEYVVTHDEAIESPLIHSLFHYHSCACPANPLPYCAPQSMEHRVRHSTNPDALGPDTSRVPRPHQSRRPNSVTRNSTEQ